MQNVVIVTKNVNFLHSNLELFVTLYKTASFFGKPYNLYKL